MKSKIKTLNLGGTFLFGIALDIEIDMHFINIMDIYTWPSKISIHFQDQFYIIWVKYKVISDKASGEWHVTSGLQGLNKFGPGEDIQGSGCRNCHELRQGRVWAGTSESEGADGSENQIRWI